MKTSDKIAVTIALLIVGSIIINNAWVALVLGNQLVHAAYTGIVITLGAYIVSLILIGMAVVAIWRKK